MYEKKILNNEMTFYTLSPLGWERANNFTKVATMQNVIHSTNTIRWKDIYIIIFDFDKIKQLYLLLQSTTLYLQLF